MSDEDNFWARFLGKPLEPEPYQRKKKRSQAMADEISGMLADPDAKEAILDRLRAQSRQANAEADVAELEAAKKRREEVDILAANKNNYTYNFDVAVSDNSVNECIKQLTIWHRQSPTEPITIVFNSPGGSIIAGFALFDFIQWIRKNGHYVTVKTYGFAASMAGILLQSGDHRVIGHESVMLIHEASFGAVGKIGEVEDTTDLVKRLMKRILKIFAARSHMSEAQIAHRWKRRDWWLLSDECLKYGFVDEVEDGVV